MKLERLFKCMPLLWLTCDWKFWFWQESNVNGQMCMFFMVSHVFCFGIVKMLLCITSVALKRMLVPQNPKSCNLALNHHVRKHLFVLKKIAIFS